MAIDRWQAPDRDSPVVAKFDATVELGEQLDQLLQMEGRGGTKEHEVQEVTGQYLSRPRRWHKIFERMGLIFQDASGSTRLTELGAAIRRAKSEGGREFRRSLTRRALSVLRKYQLRNPADETSTESYPSDADLHPYWAMWKAAVELDGKLHWDELNRVLMWVLRHADLDKAIARIKAARKQPNYDPEKDGTAELKLGERAYVQDTSTDGRDPAGQVRDQKTTPWFKRAGLGELLMVSPGREGAGYWAIHPDVIDLVQEEVKRGPPSFREFKSEQEWFEYFGRAEEVDDAGAHESLDALLKDLPDSNEVWKKVTQLIDSGSVGIILSGPPGTSKTWYARRIAARLANGDAKRVCFIQFHPSYSYDDFVEGYVPDDEHGGIRFAVKSKLFLQFCSRARTDQSKTHVLVIDELNRGDPSRIFGEFLTYIERDYRDQSVLLAYSGKHVSVPRNLLILATMNPYDKSVVDLDDALERRFERIPLDPSIDLLRNMLEKAGMHGELIGKVISFFNLSNTKSPHGLGHAFFLGVKDEAGLRRLWDHKLRFIFEKMFRFEPEVLKEVSLAYEAMLTQQQSATA